MCKNISKKTKIILIAIASFIVVAAAVALMVLYIPGSLPIDIDKVEYVGTETQVKVEAGKPVALYKMDGEEISSAPFKILTFTDTHLDTYTKKGKYTLKYFVENIKMEKPDLVIIDGDLVTSASNRKRAKQFCELMEKMGIYWITTLGNHEGDNARSISRKEFVDIYSSYEHCLIENDTKKTESGDVVWGYGNTQINILTTGGAVAQSLFFLDSGNEISVEDANKYGVEEGSYDFIKNSQITWYCEQVDKLETGAKAMVFFHIPLPEFATAVSELQIDENDNFVVNVPSQNGTYAEFGFALEKVSCSKYNSGFFDAIKDDGHTQAIICGHDHVNYFSINYQGIDFIYSRMSGYSSYNAYKKGMKDELGEGATIFNIKNDGTYEIVDILNSERFPDDQEELKELYK